MIEREKRIDNRKGWKFYDRKGGEDRQ